MTSLLHPHLVAYPAKAKPRLLWVVKSLIIRIRVNVPHELNNRLRVPSSTSSATFEMRIDTPSSSSLSTSHFHLLNPHSPDRCKLRRPGGTYLPELTGAEVLSWAASFSCWWAINSLLGQRSDRWAPLQNLQTRRPYVKSISNTYSTLGSCFLLFSGFVLLHVDLKLITSKKRYIVNTLECNSIVTIVWKTKRNDMCLQLHSRWTQVLYLKLVSESASPLSPSWLFEPPLSSRD